MEITPLIKEDFLIIQDDATVSEMIGKLKQFEKRSALIFRNKKYLGLIEKKRLLKLHLDTKNTKVKNFVQKTSIVSEHADLIETAYLMYQSNQEYLPVEKNKQIIGVITGLDVIKMAMRLPEAKKWKVKDFKLVKSKIDKNNPVSKALQVMYQKRVDQVPVFEKGSLFGILSYRDILRKYLNWSPKRDVSAKFNKMASTKSAEVDMPKLASLPVSSFSTNENIASVSEEAGVVDATTLMVKQNISDTVVYNDKFEGLLTVKNILRKIASLKIPINYNIKFVGLSKLDLDSYQKKNIKKVAANEAFKLQRSIKNEFSLVIHIKSYEKDGAQHKYTVNIRVEYPGQSLSTSQEDWNEITALRKAFENAKNAAKKRFKGDSSRRKGYE